ncbi:hypothetical protein A2U01_0084182, partial [Trifolium medium]|nr:hypothetical protein [Trifolium medium]
LFPDCLGVVFFLEGVCRSPTEFVKFHGDDGFSAIGKPERSFTCG